MACRWLQRLGQRMIAHRHLDELVTISVLPATVSSVAPIRILDTASPAPVNTDRLYLMPGQPVRDCRQRRDAHTAIAQKYAAPYVLHGTINVDPRLSHLQETVMRFFSVHRIATTNLIYRTWPEHFPYPKKANRCLRSLVDRGLLKERTPGTKFDDIIFTITEEGYRTCRDIPGTDLNSIPYQYEEPTGRQADHELLITQTAVKLYEYAMTRRGVRILKDGRFGNENGVFAAKIPDYHLLSEDRNGLMFRIVEVISGAQSSVIRAMFEGWDAWRQTTEAQEYLCDLYRSHGAVTPTPELRITCIIHSRNWKYTDAWKERLALQHTMDVSPWLQARVETTTLDALSAADDHDLGINHPMWRRGRDLAGEPRRKWRAGEYNRKGTFETLVQQLQTYSLFA